MVVGALIFVLGIDLVKEALWDTRHRVSRTEYITIASIMVAMTVWDFVIGVLFGIIVSCGHLRSFFDDVRGLILTPRRHILCRSELTAMQHTCNAHRRNNPVHCAPA